MSQEDRVDETQHPQESTSDADTQLPATIPSVSAESGVIISNHQIQSIDIAAKFTRQRTPAGWCITLQRPCKVTVNLTTSMRKIEISLVEGDTIEKDETDVAILRKHASEVYKPQRSGASLARSREELLKGETTDV